MKARLAKFFASPKFRVMLSLVISGLALYLAARNVSLESVWQTITSADLRFVGLALISVVINNLVKGVRWKVLMGEKGSEISIQKSLMGHLTGQMLNTTFAPARVGELIRAYLIGGLGPGRVFLFGTVMVEKVLDMIAYALLFIVLILLVRLPDWMSGSGYTFIIVTVFFTLGLLFITIRRDWVFRVIDRLLQRFPDRIQARTAHHLRSGLTSLDVLQRRLDLLKMVLWTVLVWITAISTIYLTLLAFDLYLPLTASLLALIALQAGISIPSVPGNVGVFEYICVLALSLFGVDQAQALSFGITLHAIVFLPMIVTGAISFWLLSSGEDRAGLMEASKGS